MSDQHQLAFYNHMNCVMELCQELTAKTAHTSLGPADGNLYMQLCNTITSYAKGLEETFDGRNEDTDESPSDDAGPEGDQPPGPEE